MPSETHLSQNHSTTGALTRPTPSDTSPGASKTHKKPLLGRGLDHDTLQSHTISLVDECILKHTAAGLDFSFWVDGYITGFQGIPETYFIKTPTDMLMFHHGRVDNRTGEPREYWHIHYLATRNKNKLDLLFHYMPYYLPEVGIARPFKNSKGFNFYKTDRLRQLCTNLSSKSS